MNLPDKLIVSPTNSDSSARHSQIAFFHWLMKVLEPRTVLELSCQADASFQVFCAAAKEAGIGTSVHAVLATDGSSIGSIEQQDSFNALEAIARDFQGVASVSRQSLEEARAAVQAGTIDMLHITGTDAIDALSRFEAWRGVISDTGIALLGLSHNGSDKGDLVEIRKQVTATHPRFFLLDDGDLCMLAVGLNVRKEVLDLCSADGVAKLLVDSLCKNLGTAVAASAELRRQLARLQDQQATSGEARQRIDKKLYGLIARNEQNQAELARLERQLEEMKSSRSWRMTGGYRAFGKAMATARRLVAAIKDAIQRHDGIGRLTRNLLRLARQEGPRGLMSAWRRTRSKIGAGKDRNDYAAWLGKYATRSDAHLQQMQMEIEEWVKPPVISVIMPVYNAQISWLEEAINSVQAQIYPNWQLCIADDRSTKPEVRQVLERYASLDPRIEVVFRLENGHISEASNSALALANGTWMALLDQDDLLTDDAFFYIARAIRRQPQAQLVYSDEDKIQDGRRFDPYFKPDWNPDLLLSQNMICHLGVYRLDRVRALGAFRKGFEGAQDHDLVLRFTEGLDHRQIVHVPRVLYHWRSHSGSTAQSGGNKNYAAVAGQKALVEHIQRLGIGGSVEIAPTGMYRVKYDLPDASPLISLIIPTRNGLKLLRQCITSIVDKTTYPNYEIIIVNNNSDDSATIEYLRDIQANDRIRVIDDARPFNYSAINNNAVRHARGDFIGLVNNDIEVITPGWLEEMLAIAAQPAVGTVGARLWYPNNTLQHGGVILGIGGVAGHAHKLLPKGAHGYFSRGELTQTISVVTAACLLVRKSTYLEVGGLDEDNLKVAFNDVDFCLKVLDAGYRNVWTPFAELYHHESATRGIEDSIEKKERFRGEVLYMLTRWGTMLINDPAYNPNLTLDFEDFSLAWPPRNDTDPTLAS